MTNIHFKLGTFTKSTAGAAAGLSVMTPAHAASFAVMQGWPEYLLMGSLALLVVSVISKAITMFTNRDVPAPAVPGADATFTIGSYRNRVLTPNY
jgi:uncharacterized membrane protein YgdD (TMEM256/DUF423 family)